jgi:hypothetical protein
MSLKLNTASGGSITLQEADTASNLTLTVPAQAGSIVTANSSGNVGIGTTSPARKLHVHESAGGTNAYFQLSNSATGATSTDGFQAIVGTGGEVILAQRENAQMELWTNNTERMRIDSSGRVTTPYQPAFRAGFSSTWAAPSGVNTIPFSSEIFDISSNYNTSTYRFTAPVAGRYLFACTIGSGGTSNTFTFFGILVYVNASQVVNGWQSKALTSSSYVADSKTILLNLAANDYVEMKLEIQNSQDITSGSFSGYLVG